jgi:hypothetical protein
MKKVLTSNNLNLSELRNETKKYGWYPAFERMVLLFKELYRKVYICQEPLNFPYLFSAKLILDIFEGFKDLRIKSGTKSIFVASTLIDHIFYNYQIIQRKAPLTIPPVVERLMLRSIRKIRYLSGDRKGIYE